MNSPPCSLCERDPGTTRNRHHKIDTRLSDAGPSRKQFCPVIHFTGTGKRNTTRPLDSLFIVQESASGAFFSICPVMYIRTHQALLFRMGVAADKRNTDDAVESVFCRRSANVRSDRGKFSIRIEKKHINFKIFSKRTGFPVPERTNRLAKSGLVEPCTQKDNNKNKTDKRKRTP